MVFNGEDEYTEKVSTSWSLMEIKSTQRRYALNGLLLRG